MRVLVLCEESQMVTKAFREKGHEAYSCDIKECTGGHPEWHFQGDAFKIIEENPNWDLVICHPPCTHLSTSGARHFENKRIDGRQREAIEFFCKMLNLDVPRLCVENPINIISGNYIKEYFPDLCEKYGLPLKPTQIIQPYEFGDPSKKTTCLWLKGLPPLKPTKIVKPDLVSYVCKDGRKVTFSRDYIEGLGKDRGTKRSKTYKGIAEAMANQWSNCDKLNLVIKRKLF